MDLLNFLDKASIWVLKTYYRLRRYIYQGVYYKKHIYLEKDEGVLKLKILDHEDFLDEKTKVLNSFKNKKNEAKYIKYALDLALDGCNFVIFSKGEKFVQFWVSRKKLDFNFPVLSTNGNKRYYLQTLGLLADMDFVRNELMDIRVNLGEKDVRPYKYVVNKVDPNERINAYFNRRMDQATEFTQRMFKEVYKNNKEKLKIDLG